MLDRSEPIRVMEGYRFGVTMNRRRICALVDFMVSDDSSIVDFLDSGDSVISMFSCCGRHILYNVEYGFIFTFEHSRNRR